MQKGKNSVSIACTLELINTLKEFSSRDNQNEGFHLAKRLLVNDAEFKTRFIEKYGEEVYRKTVEHYSKTNIEQREERRLKEEEAKIREEAKQKIEKLKAEAYANQTDLAKEKLDREGKSEQKERESDLMHDPEIQQLLRLKEYNEQVLAEPEKHPSEVVENAKKNLPIFKEKLKALGVQN